MRAQEKTGIGLEQQASREPEKMKSMVARTLILGLLTVSLMVSNSSVLLAQNADLVEGTYQIKPGDVLSLDVWNEPDFSLEQVRVRPDGFISVPVIGEVDVGNKTVAESQRAVANRLQQYLRDAPNVVVGLLATAGNQIFVLGKVQRPGAFPLAGPTDVAQALALAGGINQFAAANKIKVLRRDDKGVQRSFKFRYGDVRDGDRLDSNILLRGGDIVVVP